jgi:hypothetical protein
MFTFSTLTLIAADGQSSLSLDGSELKEIRKVSLRPDGQVMILFSGGGGQYAPDKLPKEFLASWGITTEMVGAMKGSAKQDDFEKALQLGQFRVVEGIVYDLRRRNSAWSYFSNVKLLQKFRGGALVDPTPDIRSPQSYMYCTFPTLSLIQSGSILPRSK